jgi:preprotein translocase subunit YajC
MGITALAASHSTTVLAASSTKSSSSSFTPLLIIIVLFGLFYMFIIRPQRNKQRANAAKQSQAMPGQRVRTTAGIYGTLVSGDDRDVVVEIAPGVEITMLRKGIMEVIPDDDEAGTPGYDPTYDTEQSNDEDDNADENGYADEDEDQGEDENKPADHRGDLTI